MKRILFFQNMVSVISCFFLLTAFSPEISRAEIASDDAFSNASWEMVGEYPVAGATGVVQSVCCTEDYIICIENYNDLTTEPDVVSAYYKNNTDGNGNPVDRFSLAKQVQKDDFAHANGMAYNPVTDEILVSGYSSVDPANSGCIFRMDPHTLEQKERLHLSDTFNYLGIDYCQEADRYLIQTDQAGGYRFQVLDSSFQVIDDWGPYSFASNGTNFQDLCLSGDYFMIFPVTLFTGAGNYLETYSLSRKTMVSNVPVSFPLEEDLLSNEPEDLCELSPGEFLAIVNVTLPDQTKRVRFYRTEIPYYFHITTSASHGTITTSGLSVLKGTDGVISYSPEEGYELSSLLIDHQKVPLSGHENQFTFSSMTSDHTIQAVFTPLPKITEEESSTPEDSGSTPLPSEQTTEETGSSSSLLLWNRLRPFVLLCLLIILLFYLRLIVVRRLKKKRSRQSLSKVRRYYREYEPDDWELPQAEKNYEDS